MMKIFSWLRAKPVKDWHYYEHKMAKETKERIANNAPAIAKIAQELRKMAQEHGLVLTEVLNWPDQNPCHFYYTTFSLVDHPNIFGRVGIVELNPCQIALEFEKYIFKDVKKQLLHKLECLVA